MDDLGFVSKTVIPSIGSSFGPKSYTQSPSTSGTSVLGIRYNGGVVIAADCLASYGSMARYRTVQRLMKVNDSTVIGCMGDYADFQFLKDAIEQMAVDDMCKDDDICMTPRSLHSWLTRVLYNKRSKMDPLWTTLVVGGVEDGKEFLGFVDKLGTAYKDPIIATGFGSLLATPIMRAAYRENLTEEEAVKIIQDSMKILFYRDARAFNKYHIAIVNSAGCQISGPLEITPNWSHTKHMQGTE